ncbi:queuine tRNA-ribosyltransferase [Schizosaccharomyces cryophilus OY26]|uniref:Queuine tRNA-ribosyltransferase catalytic subunit 1 n=1 Tax=Schizosaccharomyces cryophilus (strain OY26 / ATCC MYA-4695 / CBS 11777 / NBRC 106824 / NRRL Y48691) TaxID=653667 RepID=S9XAF6_SCHCR|nr:queuine tRNA-ribosyltransferase [Schizosaccharomyces cryophilus OY26]EPY50746.1 queuine tRNA-ribosyltransferase [Schizosaccharomyces cryophilus OY26]
MVSSYPALNYKVIAKCSTTRARASILELPHGPVEGPVFMPVGTQASLKGVLPEQLDRMGCQIMLNNTYHLGLKPGKEVLHSLGGAHKLQSWKRNLLTDSGGFQMVSLLKLATITEEGVTFLSPRDGTPMLLTPEHSMELQNTIGSDIMMQLDDVVHTLTEDTRMEEAMYRSIRWLDRCIEAHKNTDTQNLFCIIQGGLNKKLREICCKEMMKRDTPGIAVGGLSGGEEKTTFCEVVHTCTGILPENKPRYLMGVGYAEDLVVCVALGMDMFDCVYPTRTARFGNALTRNGILNLRNQRFKTDMSSLEEGCLCPCCVPKEKGGWGITRAFLNSLVSKETVGAHLVTIHNTHFQLQLMRDMRSSIIKDCFPQFVKTFFSMWHNGDRSSYPEWAVNALRLVNIDLLED